MATYTITDTGNADTNGTNLQTQLNNCAQGDVIELIFGVNYRCNAEYGFRFPAYTGTSGIQVKTTGTLPSTGTRIVPQTHGAQLAKLTNKYANAPTCTLEAGAHHWQLIGLDITNEPPVGQSSATGVIVQWGGSAPTGYPTAAQKLAQTGLLIDRCYIHPSDTSYSSPDNDTIYSRSERGIQADSAETTIRDCCISGFAAYDDFGAHPVLASMAVFSVAGPGPLTVQNCKLEANYNPFFLGGGDAPPKSEHSAVINASSATTASLSTTTGITIGTYIAFPTNTSPAWEVGKVTDVTGSVVTFEHKTGTTQPFDVNPYVGGTCYWDGYVWPANVTVTKCLLTNRAAWADTGGTYMKGWIEVKCCDTFTFTGNVCVCYPFYYTPETRWLGSLLAFPTYNQAGSAPWTAIKNVTVQNCWLIGIRNEAAVALQGSDPYNVTNEDSQDYLFSNIVMEDPIGHDTDSQLVTHQGGAVGLDNVVFNHITCLNSYYLAKWSAAPVTGFVLKNSVVRHGKASGTAGFNCQLSPNTQDTCWPSLSVHHNMLIDPNYTTSYSPGPNTYKTTVANVGFTDVNMRDYRLTNGSSGDDAADDGTDIGVNFTTLYNAISSTDWPVGWTPINSRAIAIGLEW